MGKATAVPVTPRVVEWAVTQSGMSEAEVARKVKPGFIHDVVRSPVS
jgi:hypothetical protein